MLTIIHLTPDVNVTTDLLVKMADWIKRLIYRRYLWLSAQKTAPTSIRDCYVMTHADQKVCLAIRYVHLFVEYQYSEKLTGLSWWYQLYLRDYTGRLKGTKVAQLASPGRVFPWYKPYISLPFHIVVLSVRRRQKISDAITRTDRRS